MQSRAKSHKNGRHRSRKRHFRWLIIVISVLFSVAMAMGMQNLAFNPGPFAARLDAALRITGRLPDR